jgi:hypothetical protein
VQQSVLKSVDRLRHSLDSRSSEQKDAAFNEITKHMGEMASVIDRQTKAIHNLDAERAKEKLARRREIFRNRLVDLFTEGNSLVGSKDQVEKHLGLLLELNESQAERHFEIIEAAPKMQNTKRFRPDEIIRNTDSSDESVMKHRFESDENKFAREKLGMNYDEFELLDRWADLQENL